VERRVAQTTVPSLFDLPFEEPPPEPGPAPPGRRTFTVSELTAALRRIVDEAFYEVWVEGEISNCRPYNGHLYFTLKDSGAQMRGFMFQSSLRRLKFTPKDGQHVLARGRLSVYDRRGEYQLVAEHLEPQGLGALQAAFDELKARLGREGLFEAARKRPLPPLPRRIGVVTSLDGAAVRDVLKVLLARVPTAQVILRDTRVQGQGAAREIAAALAAVARAPGVDVVILARGGGSIEDLWAFNEEPVARAIASCAVPVVTGVGHETDFTIADFVADVRAATPSNAAELVRRATSDLCGDVDRLRHRADAALRRGIERRRLRTHVLTTMAGLARVPTLVANLGREVADLGSHALDATRAHLTRRTRRLQGTAARLEAQAPARRVAAMAARAAKADGRLAFAARRGVAQARSRFGRTAAQLEALSPLGVLGRGYAVCWDATHTAVLREARPDLEGKTVHVRLARGELECRVTGALSSES
jgi:exodeoxyribonuclease VII large subunit